MTRLVLLPVLILGAALFVANSSPRTPDTPKSELELKLINQLTRHSIEPYAIQVDFDLAVSIPGTGVRDSNQPVASTQNWSITAHRDGSLVGRLIWSNRTEPRDVTFFGEDGESVWWTVGAEQRIYPRSEFSLLEQSSEASALFSARQLVQQARDELDNILRIGRFGAKLDNIRILESEGTESDLAATGDHTGHKIEFRLKRQGSADMLTIVEQFVSGDTCQWAFHDFREEAGFSVPSLIDYSFRRKDGTLSTYSYSSIDVRSTGDAVDGKYRIFEPAGSHAGLILFRTIYQEGNEMLTQIAAHQRRLTCILRISRCVACLFCLD